MRIRSSCVLISPEVGMEGEMTPLTWMDTTHAVELPFLGSLLSRWRPRDLFWPMGYTGK